MRYAEVVEERREDRVRVRVVDLSDGRTVENLWVLDDCEDASQAA